VVVLLDKVAAMEAKIEALTAELQEKSLEQETLKQTMSIGSRFDENDEMDANENDVIGDEV
jgi:hypothetical protein